MSEESVQVPIDELRKVFDLLLRHVSDQAGGRLEVEHDYFWSVAPADLNNVYKQPSELTVGQVSESWANLVGMLEDDSKVVSYGLVWLSDVLRTIGAERIA